MKRLLLLMSLLCIKAVFAGAIEIELNEKDPLTLNGLRYESFNGEALKDSSRLVIDGKVKTQTPPSVVITAPEEYKAFAVKIITHHQFGPDVLGSLNLFGSADGKQYSKLDAEVAGKPVDLPGGYRAWSLKGMAAQPQKYFKIEIINVNPADSWKFQLAGVTLHTPPPATAFARPLKITFDASTPMQTDNLRQETYQAEALKLTGPRLVLGPQKDSGSLRLDMTNFDGADAFQSLTLSVLVHVKDLKRDVKDCIQAEGSDDGRNWTILPLNATGTPEAKSGGYELQTFATRSPAPFRFIKITVNNVSAKTYWHLQLSGLTLTVNGEAPSGPEAPTDGLAGYNISDSDKPAVGVRIEFDLHTLGVAKLQTAILADGKKLNYRYTDTATDAKGWRKRTLESWSDAPFAQLAGKIKSEPEWAVKDVKIQLITDKNQYFGQYLGAILDYPVKPGLAVSIPTLYADYLYTPEETASDRFDFAKWDLGKLPESTRVNAGWERVGIKREPDKEIEGALYRFRITPQFNPDSEKVLLYLQQSAFVTTVYVNGKPVAGFTEGFLPLTADLSQCLQPGQSAEITIKVLSFRHAHDNNGKVLYPVGAMGQWTGGIATAPQLRVIPQDQARELFVIPAAQTVTVQIAEPVRPGYRAHFYITDLDGNTVLQWSSNQNSHTFAVNNELRRWDIGQPNLYLARVDLEYAGQIIKGEPARFGYRTVEIRKDDLLLNGRKIRLFGPWAHIGEWTYKTQYQGKTLEPKELYQTLLQYGINTGRLHCQPFHRQFYDAADEAGFLLIAESGLAHRPANAAAMTHIESMVKELRNHPSIIIWSGSNEFEHWLTPRPEKTMTFLLDIQKKIKSLDTTRPVQHSGFGDAWGELDIYNIHYPSENTSFPRTLYWTRNPEILPNKLYVENFIKYNPIGKKPLAYGEEAIPGIRDESYLFGELALRALYADTAQSRDEVQIMLGRDWALRTRAEREQNVLLICPNIFYLGLDSEFVKKLGEEFRPAGVYPKFFTPSFPGGERELVFVFFEDSGYDFHGQTVILLRRSGQPDQKLAAFPVNLAGGSLSETSVKLRFPAESGSADLISQTFDGKGKLIYSDTTAIRLTSPAIPELAGTVTLWGNDPEVTDFLVQNNVRVNRFTEFAQLSDQVLLISPQVTSDDLLKSARQLAQFVSGGGRAVFLEYRYPAGILPSDATFNQGSNANSCIGFVRAANHPVMRGIDDLDLRYYNSDYSITRGFSAKPENGNFQILVDGGNGLKESYLWQLMYGKGFYLVNHLCLADQLSRLPQARRLTAQMIDYALNAPATSLTPAAVLATDNDFSAGILTDLGFVSGGNHRETITVTGEAIRQMSPEKIISTAQKYRNIILFNVPANQVKQLAAGLTGSAPQITPETVSDGKFYFTAEQNHYSGMSSADLNWAKKAELPYRFTSAGLWQTAIAPGADAFWSDGKRNVLFLNLPLNRDVPNSGVRSRFLSLLATNFNCTLEATQVKNLDPDTAKYRPVSLLEIANARREDYFTTPKTDNGRILSVPFQLGTQGANMLRLNAHSKLKETELAYDTPVDRFDAVTPDRVKINLPTDQADALIFLHAVNRNWKLERFRTGDQIAEYQINFTDGSSLRVPVVQGNNIADCRGKGDDISRAKLAGYWPMPKNGDGESAAVYLFTWENPTPEKKIKNIEAVNLYNPPHDLMLLGVTLRETNQTYQ